MYNQIRNIFARKPEEAFEVLPKLATLAQVLKNNKSGMSTEEANKQAYGIIRSADLMGQMTDKDGNIDMAKLTRMMNVISEVALSTEGNVGPSEWLNIAKQGGIAFSGASENGLISAGIIAQAMGGNRLGTAEMSLFQQMAGGKMTQNTATELQNLGLLNKGEWHTSKGGGIVMDSDASKRLMGMIQEDPLAFMQDMQKRMKEHGITDQQDQIREIFRIFGRATTQREMGDILRNMNQMLAEREAIKKAMDFEPALMAQNATSITAALNTVAAAFENLKTAIGGPETGKIIAVIQGFASLVGAVTNAIRLLPDTARLNILAGTLFGPVGVLFSSIANLATLDAGAITKVAHAIDVLVGVFKKFVLPFGSTGGETFGGIPATPKAPTGADTFGGAPVIKQNFIAPPQKPEIVHTTMAVNLDGSQLAKFIDQRIALLHELPDSASSSNGVAYNTLNDWNPRDS